MRFCFIWRHFIWFSSCYHCSIFKIWRLTFTQHLGQSGYDVTISFQLCSSTFQKQNESFPFFSFLCKVTYCIVLVPHDELPVYNWNPVPLYCISSIKQFISQKNFLLSFNNFAIFATYLLILILVGEAKKFWDERWWRTNCQWYDG